MWQFAERGDVTAAPRSRATNRPPGSIRTAVDPNTNCHRPDLPGVPAGPACPTPERRFVSFAVQQFGRGPLMLGHENSAGKIVLERLLQSDVEVDDGAFGNRNDPARHRHGRRGDHHADHLLAGGQRHFHQAFAHRETDRPDAAAWKFHGHHPIVGNGTLGEEKVGHLLHRRIDAADDRHAGQNESFKAADDPLSHPRGDEPPEEIQSPMMEIAVASALSEPKLLK